MGDGSDGTGRRIVEVGGWMVEVGGWVGGGTVGT